MRKPFRLTVTFALVFLICGFTIPANGQEILTISPTDTLSVGNCFPFGGTGGTTLWTPHAAFIYKDIPPFQLQPGDILAFDLGSPNDTDIELDIAMAPTTSNGSSQNDGPFTTIVTNTQTPANPRGDSTIGNFELQFTIEAPFIFSGGGLIIRFANPSPTYAADDNCDQVLVQADNSDSSGYFAYKVYGDDDGVYPWDNLRSRSIGGFRITAYGYGEPIPTVSHWGLIALSLLIAATTFWFIRRKKRVV